MRRWDQLTQAAFALDAKAAVTPADLQLWLSSVTEVFGPEVDPVEDPQGYAVRRFAGALLRAITQSTATRTA